MYGLFWDYSRKKLLPSHKQCLYGSALLDWKSLHRLTETCFLLIYFIKWFCIQSEQQAGLSPISGRKVLQQDAGGLRNCQFWTPRPTSTLAHKIRQWTQQDPTGGSLDGKNGMTLKIRIGDTNWSGITKNNKTARPYSFKPITGKFMAK